MVEEEQPDAKEVVSKNIAEQKGAERDERGDHQGDGWIKEGVGERARARGREQEQAGLH